MRMILIFQENTMDGVSANFNLNMGLYIMLNTVNEQLTEIMARYNELYVKEEYKVTDKNAFLEWFLGEADYPDERFESCFVEIPRHEARCEHAEIFEVFLNEDETVELCKEYEDFEREQVL